MGTTYPGILSPEGGENQHEQNLQSYLEQGAELLRGGIGNCQTEREMQFIIEQEDHCVLPCGRAGDSAADGGRCGNERCFRR